MTKLASLLIALSLAALCLVQGPGVAASGIASESRDTPGDMPGEQPPVEAVVDPNRWSFRRRKRARARPPRDNDRKPRRRRSWRGGEHAIDSVIPTDSNEVLVQVSRPQIDWETPKISSSYVEKFEGMKVLCAIIAHASNQGWKTFTEVFDELGTMLVAFGVDEKNAASKGGYLVTLFSNNARLGDRYMVVNAWQGEVAVEADIPLDQIDLSGIDLIRVDWCNFEPENLVEAQTEHICSSHERRGSWGEGRFVLSDGETSYSSLVAMLGIIAAATSVALGLEEFLSSGLLGLAGTYEWTFRRKIQMENTVNPSTQRAFERLGSIQSVAGDPIQNIIDAHDKGEIPPEAVLSIFDGDHSLAEEKASKYFNRLREHINAVKDGGEISKQERLRALLGPVAHLNIEDFHTLGLEGDPSDDQISWIGMLQEAIDKLKKNRFFWFFRAQNATSDDQDRRGSWGEGKFTLEAASLIGAQISMSIRNTASGLSRVLMGQTTLRWHGIYSPGKGHGETGNDGTPAPYQYDPYGSFSRAKNDEAGAGYAPMPIEDDDYMDEFASDFRLLRGDMRGLSVVIPQPRHELRDPAVLARAIIARWWVAIKEDKLTVRIRHNGVDVFTIDSSTLREVIDDLDWDAEPDKIGSKGERNPAKLTIEQWDALLDLHDWAEDPPDEAVFETSEAGCEYSSQAPSWEGKLSEEQVDRIKERLSRGEECLIMMRVWVHKIPEDLEGQYYGPGRLGSAEFVLKPANEAMQTQVYTRRGMTIPFSVQSDGYVALIRCDGTSLEEILRDSEGPAHLEWERGAHRVKPNAGKWKYGYTTVEMASHGIRSIHKLCNVSVVEPHQLLKKAFTIQIPKENPVPRCPDCDRPKAQCICTCPVCGDGTSKADCPGHRTPDFVSVPTSRSDGTCRLTRYGDFSGAGRTIQVRVAYDRSRRDPFSMWKDLDFNHSDISVATSEGASVVGVSTPLTRGETKWNKDTGGVCLTILIEDDDFEVIFGGWTPNRDLKVRIEEVMS